LALEEFDKALGGLRQRQLGIYTRVSYLIVRLFVTVLQGHTWKHNSSDTIAAALATFSTREHECHYGNTVPNCYAYIKAWSRHSRMGYSWMLIECVIDVVSQFLGKNVFYDWAKIVDCGDAPLTFLVSIGHINQLRTALTIHKDNTIALKQLDTSHQV
jgi:hypothetical protein